MVYSYTWNTAFEAAPPDTGENISGGANRIRNLKVAIRERMENDHYWDEGGTDADHGEHSKITFHANMETPSNVANKSFLFPKTAGGIIELHYLDSANQETQITANGLMNTFPSGTAMWFYQNTAPTGWTIANLADVILAVKGGNEAYGVDGGQEGGSWTQANHTHEANHTHAIDHANWTNTYSPGAAGVLAVHVSDASLSSVYRANEGRTSGASSNATTSANATANTWRPSAAIGIVATKD